MIFMNIYSVCANKLISEKKMANSSAEIRSLLKDVSLLGVIIISKKKLLWMLNWGQDRPGAWRDLLGHWKEIGDSDSLHGIEVADKVVLMVRPHKLTPISEWTETEG
jgi:hypothetical protein